MSIISRYHLFLIFTIIFHSRFVSGDNAVAKSPERETLEIIIGGGGGPAPPPEGVCPPPPPPPATGLPPNIIRDYNTIQKFKKTINCDPQGITDTWKEGVFNVCDTYKGFACEKRPDTGVLSVAAVDFNGYNFSGPNFQINDFLNQLKDLAIFHANSNDFTGIVPQDIGAGNINFLYELDLSNNKYTSGFPTSVVGATNLIFLDLRFNSFYGSVPSQVFNLDLDVLFLNNNNFDRQLPDNIGQTSAFYLTFANNRFTGPIPRSIGRAKNLLEVLFLNNRLTGCLPFEIGYLEKTIVFDVSFNELTGPVPLSFGCLASIQILNLEQNKFFGEVPEMLCKLPNLQHLILSGNYFTRVGPECRKLISMKKLDIRNNCIEGLEGQKPRPQCLDFFSKPLDQCAHQKSLLYIPCKQNGHQNSPESAAYQASMAPAASPPRSYEALSPNHKFRF